MRILRINAVKDKVGLSKSHIYNLIDKESFPRPKKLSDRAVGWFEEDIDQWILNKPYCK